MYPVIFSVILLIILSFCYRKKIQRQIDNAVSKSVLNQITLLAAVTGIVFGLLFTAMLFIHGADALELSIYDSIFAFINPGSSFVNITEGAGKIWAIIIGICGMILLGGFLISIFSNILARRVEKVRYGQVYYDFENHVVIIGYDSMVIDLVMQHPSVEIVLQTLRKAPEVRHELFSKLTSGIEKNVTIVSGNRDATEDLEKLCIHKAKVLYILGEKGEQDRDSINIESLKKINKILLNTQAGANKPCFVLIENQSTYAVLQQQDVNGLRVERTMKNGMKETLSYPAFHPFNIPELWAQKLFADCKYEHKENEKESENYLPLDRTGICYDSDNTVHLVILGMSKMGVALGIQASHLCHFPNFIRDNRLKTRITFVDENADREMYFLKGRYRYLFHETDCAYEDTEQPEKSHDNKQRPKFTDIEWRFVKGRVERPEVRERLTAYSNEKHTLLTVAVCFGSPAAAIACGLYLPDEIYQSGAQILVRQDTHHSILSMLGSTGKYGNVKPFGMTDLCPDLSRNSDRLPMIVNYVYDYYYHHLEIPDSVPPMVEMEKLWEKLKTAKKWSNRYNANMLAVKQRAFGLCPGEPPEDRTVELLAEVEHNRWNIEELLLGYRPTTPEEKKEIGSNYTWKEKMKKDFVHNDICPYHAIPDMDTEPEKANGNKIKNTRSYDICLSKAIPMILEYIGKE